MKWMGKGKSLGVTLALIFFSIFSVKGQDADLALRVEANETVQSINIQSLVSNDGEGTNLFRMFLRNNSSQHVDDLYLEIIVSSDKVGRIVELTQVNNRPFSLSPAQQVYATNNNLSNGLPGIEESIGFEGDLTPEGEEFVNNMQGSTSLPAGRYTIEVNIYQGPGLQYLIASDIGELGANITEGTNSFYLFAPGDVVGSNSVISNSYPNFQWQGVSGSSYRLLVVEEKGNESPQSLLESAASSAPIRELGVSAGGSLLGFEMLDVVINRSSFQYPNSGVQDLEAGKTYYWRVIGQLKTSEGQETRESEIWSFSLLDNKNRQAGITGRTQELSEALKILLGGQFARFDKQGYVFQSLRSEEQVFKGGKAIQKLKELSRRAEEGEISIIIENE